MAMASALPLLLVSRPVSALPTVAGFRCLRLALPPQPATFAVPVATLSRKDGRREPLCAASCCNGSSAAAGTATAGGGGGGIQDWRLLAWYLMALDKNPVMTKAVTSAVLTLAGDLICQFIFSPIFIGVFMSLLVTMEGKPSLVVPKLKQEWSSSVMANWQLWIPFQFLNFYFVPQKLQVLAANFVALAWNVILSFKAHKEIVAK
ncbi:hypothetical protein PR202_gb16522 [Eleusine coracana subsp. coracana]|uniref:Uncharacterized protein n=1 Tax=Eleusine coracana subsp. coracana TaxID=191504 RepID=A0AAV5F1P3_ELECO|nr:hypothetical protein PR202_gb16522 [Eleusine coracana subsp. coracana]